MYFKQFQVCMSCGKSEGRNGGCECNVGVCHLAWTWHQLSFESLDNSDDVLPADGALCHLLAAVGAGAHVAALQHHAVNRRVHGFDVLFVLLLLLPEPPKNF